VRYRTQPRAACGFNYRNTRQILQTASLIAADLLTADDKDDDGIPLVKPEAADETAQRPSSSACPARATKPLPLQTT
jgi:hypothetical protein